MNKSETLFAGFADLPKKVRNLLIALEIAILEVEIEQKRIKDGLEKLATPNNFPRLTDKRKAEHLLEDELVHETLMADIHLWLVAWGNVNKILLNLRKITQDSKLDWIQERRKKWFLKIRNARNSLEHIDERTMKSESKISPIEDLYLEYQNNKQINVFDTKIKFDDSTFNKIINLKKDLHRWHSNLPTIFDTMAKKYN